MFVTDCEKYQKYKEIEMSDYIHIKFKKGQIGIYKRQELSIFYANNAFADLRLKIQTLSQIDRSCSKILFDLALRFNRNFEGAKEEVLKYSANTITSLCNDINQSIHKPPIPARSLEILVDWLVIRSFKLSKKVTEKIISSIKTKRVQLLLSIDIFQYITFECREIINADAHLFNAESRFLLPMIKLFYTNDSDQNIVTFDEQQKEIVRLRHGLVNIRSMERFIPLINHLIVVFGCNDSVIRCIVGIHPEVIPEIKRFGKVL